MVNVFSKGNSNSIQNINIANYYAGLLGIRGSDGEICGSYYDYNHLCDPDIHLVCAQKLYRLYGWKYWAAAKACDCDSS